MKKLTAPQQRLLSQMARGLLLRFSPKRGYLTVPGDKRVARETVWALAERKLIEQDHGALRITDEGSEHEKQTHS